MLYLVSVLLQLIAIAKTNEFAKEQIRNILDKSIFGVSP